MKTTTERAAICFRANLPAKQGKISALRRALQESATFELNERERVVITLDKWCRRDPAEVLHADRIHRHTLIDDNPTSG